MELKQMMIVAKKDFPGITKGKSYKAIRKVIYGRIKYEVKADNGIYHFEEDFSENSASELFDIPPYSKEVDLTRVETKKLVEELSKREGVREHWVDPYVPYQLSVNSTDVEDDFGSAIILVVID